MPTRLNIYGQAISTTKKRPCIVATTTNIVAGLYIARPPTASFAGMNLANSAVAHPSGNCRLYYSRTILK